MVSPKKTLSPRGRWIFGFLFAGFSSIFLVFGGGMAWHQEQRLKSAQKIPAVIDTSVVESRSGGKGGTTYSPKITFHYRVAGTDYHSEDVYPITSSSGADEAEAIVQQFRPGHEVTAWYDSSNPGSAFLVHQCSFFPYIFMLFPMVHITAGLSIALLAGTLPLQRAQRLGLITTIWWAVGIICAGHYAFAGGIFATLPTVAFSIYAGLGCIWIFIWRKMSAGIATTATPAQNTTSVTDEPNPFRQQ